MKFPLLHLLLASTFISIISKDVAVRYIGIAKILILLFIFIAILAIGIWIDWDNLK